MSKYPDMNDIEKAVLYALRAVNENADEVDVAVFITALLGKEHIVKPLSDEDKAEIRLNLGI